MKSVQLKAASFKFIVLRYISSDKFIKVLLPLTTSTDQRRWTRVRHSNNEIEEFHREQCRNYLHYLASLGNLIGFSVLQSSSTFCEVEWVNADEEECHWGHGQGKCRKCIGVENFVESTIFVAQHTPSNGLLCRSELEKGLFQISAFDVRIHMNTKKPNPWITNDRIGIYRKKNTN